jgi:Photoprotection regulator fluorescence recovery protein
VELFLTGDRGRACPSALFVMVVAAPDTLFRKDNVMRDWKWSHAEKIVARQAFEQALYTEGRELIREAKDRAAAVEEVSELWQLESWLTQRRREIERQYDYRYSVLPFVFATLIQQGRLRESDLQGLALEKIELIRHMASQRVT